MVADLRQTCSALDETEATRALETFDELWGDRYLAIADLWRRNWERFTPFLASMNRSGK